MKCPNCGTEVGDAKFCTECGTPMKSDVKRYSQPEPEKEKPKKKKGLGCFTVIIFVLIFWIIVVASGGDRESVTTGTASRTPSVSASSETSNLTMGQKNALRSAENYLNSIAFSHDGLIHQLEYEGYSTEDATYAADNCGADWNEQAAKRAKNYLNTMSFSRSGLIQQLEYEGFTPSQAEYGVSANGY